MQADRGYTFSLQSAAQAASDLFFFFTVFFSFSNPLFLATYRAVFGRAVQQSRIQMEVPNYRDPKSKKNPFVWFVFWLHRSKLPYYYNRSTGETVWERPAVLDTRPALTPYPVNVSQQGEVRQGTGGGAGAPSFGNDGGRRPDQFG